MSGGRCWLSASGGSDWATYLQLHNPGIFTRWQLYGSQEHKERASLNMQALFKPLLIMSDSISLAKASHTPQAQSQCEWR